MMPQEQYERNRAWCWTGTEAFGTGTITVSSMVRDESLRLLSITSGKSNCCHQGLCDAICKEKCDFFSGLYMQNIQQLAVCFLESHFGPYALTCFSFFRVLRPILRRALWKPYPFFWCVEHTATINPMQLKDTAKHAQYPSTRVVKMGVTQQEAGKQPDTLGKWCNSPFSGGNSLLNPSSNELLAWSWS